MPLSSDTERCGILQVCEWIVGIGDFPRLETWQQVFFLTNGCHEILQKKTNLLATKINLLFLNVFDTSCIVNFWISDDALTLVVCTYRTGQEPWAQQSSMDEMWCFRGECQGLVVQDWKAALLGVSSLQCSWQRQRVLAWLQHAIPPKKTADLWYLAVWGASEINVPIPYLMYPNDPPTEINVPIQNGGHWRGDATGVIGRGITNVLTFKASYIFQSFLKCPTFLLFRAGTAFYNHIDGNDSGDWIECY